MNEFPEAPQWVRAALRAGMVIPAHPLAIDQQRRFDERRQRVLTTYYHTAKAGGIAVGVHTTQFNIRDARYGLLAPVLGLAAQTVRELDSNSGRTTVLIAGICGGTIQAVAEAALARDSGFHCGLVSLSALASETTDEMIEHCKRVAEVIPIMGFYLQEPVGGRLLPEEFWFKFAQIPNVVAIKVAPFDRYRTIDVVRGVVSSGRACEIALYTGNDDSIVNDLLTKFDMPFDNGNVSLGFAGGLLGHWACWTKRAVEIFEAARSARALSFVPAELLSLAVRVTDCNGAFFDSINRFRGSIPGIHEVLRRQGLMENNFCLDPAEVLSPGQLEEIDRVYMAYPELNDDTFVRENLDDWLR